MGLYEQNLVPHTGVWRLGVQLLLAVIPATGMSEDLGIVDWMVLSGTRVSCAEF